MVEGDEQPLGAGTNSDPETNRDSKTTIQKPTIQKLKPAIQKPKPVQKRL